MKTLYLTNGGNICIDQENGSADNIANEREAISRIYLAKEPMHVVYGCGNYNKEFDVKKDDIIITFYTDEFKDRVVVAKSKDWANNIKKYNEEEQRRKEEWAAAKQAEAECKCSNCGCLPDCPA